MPIDDRWKMKRAIEESAPGAHRGNPQREPSDPPVSGGYPPKVKTLPPSSSGGHRLESVHKSLSVHWGIAAVIATAVTAGWTAHAFLAKPLIAEAVREELKPMRDELAELKRVGDVNQRSNEASFAGIKTDIDWLKREKKVDETQPIKPERKR